MVVILSKKKFQSLLQHLDYVKTKLSDVEIELSAKEERIKRLEAIGALNKKETKGRSSVVSEWKNGAK